MDDSLYDEFGNFIGTVESDEELGGADELEERANAYLEEEEDEGEEVKEENLMQVDGTSYCCIADVQSLFRAMQLFYTRTSSTIPRLSKCLARM